MANIIDSLLVTLGLDTSNYAKGAADVEKKQKDMAEGAKKSGDQVEDSAKKQALAFAKLRGELVGLLAAYVSAKSVVSFALENTKATAQVGRSAQVFAMGTNTVNAWGDAIKAAGGDASEAAAAFGKIADIRANFVRNPAALNGQLMNQLGLHGKADFNDEEGLMYKLADQYQTELAAAKASGDPNAEKTTAATYRQRLQELLGLSDNWIAMIERGRPALQAEIANYKEKDKVTAADAEQARLTAEEFEHLEASMNGLFRAMGGSAVVKTTADLFDFLASAGLKMNDGMRHVALGFYLLTHPLAQLGALLSKMGLISPEFATSMAGLGPGSGNEWMLQNSPGPEGALGNPGGYVPTAAGGTGPNYDAVLGNGHYGAPTAPLSTMSIGDAAAFGARVLRPNSRAAGVGRDSRGLIGSSAMGAYQITAETMQRMAPGLFGRDWASRKWDGAAQEKMAEAIFNQSKGGNLHNQWANPRISSQPGYYAGWSWQQVRGLITQGEGTNSAPGGAKIAPRTPGWASNYEAAKLRANTGGPSTVTVHVDARGSGDPNKVATKTGHAVKHALKNHHRVANANTGVS